MEYFLSTASDAFIFQTIKLLAGGEEGDHIYSQQSF